jgi:hypothetical protein
MALEPIEIELLTGASVALRKRADRQAKMANDGTGEGAVAARVSLVLAELANEFDHEVARAAAAGQPNDLAR